MPLYHNDNLTTIFKRFIGNFLNNRNECSIPKFPINLHSLLIIITNSSKRCTNKLPINSDLARFLNLKLHIHSNK